MPGKFCVHSESQTDTSWTRQQGNKNSTSTV